MSFDLIQQIIFYVFNKDMNNNNYFRIKIIIKIHIDIHFVIHYNSLICNCSKSNQGVIMGLSTRLSKSKDKGDEKVITLRMPQNKVVLLEILSKHYGLTMSTLIREIIDEGIVKLAKEHLVVSEDAGMIVQDSTGEKQNIRFFSDIAESLAPELPVRIKREDYCSDKEFDEALFEEIKLSYEYSQSTTSSWTHPDGEEYVFTKKTKVKK